MELHAEAEIVIVGGGPHALAALAALHDEGSRVGLDSCVGTGMAFPLASAQRRPRRLRGQSGGRRRRLHRGGPRLSREQQGREALLGDDAPMMHRSLISKFSLKIAEFFAVFFPKFRKFTQFLPNFRQISPFFSGFLQNAAFLIFPKRFNFGC